MGRKTYRIEELATQLSFVPVIELSLSDGILSARVLNAHLSVLRSFRSPCYPIFFLLFPPSLLLRVVVSSLLVCLSLVRWSVAGRWSQVKVGAELS